jgi:hypothetical protein
MLNRDDLSKVRTVVVHADCPDGLGSAMLIHDVLRDAEIKFRTHHTAEYDELPAEPGMLFCDIVPPPERIQEFVDAGAIVLDHHKGVEDVVAKFGAHGVFADEKKDPGVSGARLAWSNIWLPLAEQAYTDANKAAGPARIRMEQVERFSRLLGIRDTWQNQSELWEESRMVSEVLSFLPTDYWLADHVPYVLDGEMKMGETLVKRHDALVKRLAEKAFRFDCGTIKLALLPGSKLVVSDAAELLRKENIDIIAGFTFYCDKEQGHDETCEVQGIIPHLAFSIRTGPAADAVAFARLFGGNGHSRAAGCGFGIAPSTSNPFALFMDMALTYAAWLEDQTEETMKSLRRRFVAVHGVGMKLD